MNDHELQTEIAVLKEKVKSLEMALAATQSELREKFDRLEAKIDNMNKNLGELVQGRPSWSITIWITVLSTLVTGLGVWVLTH